MVLEAISPCHGAAPQVPWVCHPILLSTAEAEDALDERCPHVLHLCAQSPDLSPEPLVVCTQLPQALLTLLLPACTLPLCPLPHGLPLCLWGGSPVGLGRLWCCARRAVWVQELQQLCIQCLIQLTAHWLPPCTPQWGQLFFLWGHTGEVVMWLHPSICGPFPEDPALLTCCAPPGAGGSRGSAAISSSCSSRNHVGSSSEGGSPAAAIGEGDARGR